MQMSHPGGSNKHRPQFEPDPDATGPIVALIVVIVLLMMLIPY